MIASSAALAISDVPHAKQQSFLVELMLVSVEIDGDLGCVLGRGLESADERDLLDATQICGRKLEFYLDFFWRRHCGSMC